MVQSATAAVIDFEPVQPDPGRRVLGVVDRLELLRFVIDRPDKRMADVQLISCLVGHLNTKTGRCDPGRECIARETGLDPASISESRGRFRAWGIIVTRRGTRCRGGYTLQNDLYLPPESGRRQTTRTLKNSVVVDIESRSKTQSYPSKPKPPSFAEREQKTPRVMKAKAAIKPEPATDPGKPSDPKLWPPTESDIADIRHLIPDVTDALHPLLLAEVETNARLNNIPPARWKLYHRKYVLQRQRRIAAGEIKPYLPANPPAGTITRDYVERVRRGEIEDEYGVFTSSPFVFRGV